MCLAIPGKVLESFDVNGLHMAKVRHGGIVHDVCLEYVPEAKVGDYVIVHAGFAITKVDGEEAARTYELLEEMERLAVPSEPEVEEASGATSQEKPAGATGF
jgi:hydrogenase expression/formation protein HypC